MSKNRALTQRLELPAGIPVVEPEIRRPEPEAQEVTAVLYFERKRDQRADEFVLSAKHGRGIKGREGLVVFPHRETEVSMRAGIQMVEFQLKPYHHFAFAKSVTDKAKIEEVVSDLRLQVARLDSISSAVEEIDTDAEMTTNVILKFETQTGPDGKPRLVARHGAGLSDGKGLVIFADHRSPLSIKEGWNMVSVGLWSDRKYGLAQGAMHDGWLNEAIQDLSEQIAQV